MGFSTDRLGLTLIDSAMGIAPNFKPLDQFFEGRGPDPNGSLDGHARYLA